MLGTSKIAKNEDLVNEKVIDNLDLFKILYRHNVREIIIKSSYHSSK